MGITVFAKPNCQQCAATEHRLTELGIDFTVIDLSRNPQTLAQLVDAGYRQAPVVVAPNATWSGYRPDLIDDLALHLQAHRLEDAAAQETQAA